MKNHHSFLCMSAMLRLCLQLAVMQVWILSSHRAWATGAVSFTRVLFQRNGWFSDPYALYQKHIHLERTRKDSQL